MLRVMPSVIPVQHQAYAFDGNLDHRGNPTGALSAAVSRTVIGFYRLGSSATDPISIDYLARIVTDLMMLSYEPTVYNKLDRVTVFDGSESLRYEVQGEPMSWATGYPFQRYASLLGGEVHIRRVE